MARNVIQFPDLDAAAHAQAESDRKRALFAWADMLLQQLGLTAKVAQAASVDELRKIVLDLDDVTVDLAIQEALNPAVGPRAKHFDGMRAGALKRLLKTRFNELKDCQDKLLGRVGATSGQGASPHSWTHELKLDTNGGVRPLISNLILFLRHHPVWKGVLAFDDFHLRVVIRRQPYWGAEQLDQPLADHHETLIRTWFEDEDIVASQGNIGRAVQAAAKFNRVHPVREYFGKLTWDGIPRIDAWLITYLGAADTPYIKAISPRILIAAVARILKPGCQADNTPVFEGAQGIGKSSAWAVLGGLWFADRLSAIGSKDAAQEMAGVWLMEVAEMEAIIRATAGTTKAFTSRRSDRYRPPYGKHVIDQLRQSFLVGTINPPDEGYLKDDTGARRIWPIVCTKIDLAGLARDRDQLLAEAIKRCKDDAPWWLETPELEALATAEQAKRTVKDPWHDPIEEWLGDRADTSVSEVLKEVLGLAPGARNRSAEMRIAKILTKLRFAKYRPRIKNGEGQGKQQARYWRA